MAATSMALAACAAGTDLGGAFDVSAPSASAPPTGPDGGPDTSSTDQGQVTLSLE